MRLETLIDTQYRQCPPGFHGAIPLLFREDVSAEKSRVIDKADQDEEREEQQRGLLCKSCNAMITDENQRVDIAGSHQHTFFNPAGIVFELGCFKNAPGCSAMGESSAEFTWFAGYVWRVAVCRSCSAHLGWQFTGADNLFYGLILPKLIAGTY